MRSIPYYGIHAFQWIDADGRRAVRPLHASCRRRRTRRSRRGRRAGAGRDYLQEEIARAVGAGPVRFTLELQIAIPGDPIDDPSAAWPAERRRVHVGTLELTGLETERETGGDVLVFDPTRVTDGIELSDDPVLRFRHARVLASRSRGGWR